MNKNIILLAGISAVFIFFSGCSQDALDPTQIGRFRPVPVVNVILDSLGVADEPDPIYASAEDPRPEDLIEYEQDYAFGPGDSARIIIYELRQEGVPYVNDHIITETGKISIPDVGLVTAAGLTESELEEEIKDILSPNILLEPSVTVLLLNSQSKQFSIYGNGVNQPARYPIPRYNYRLTEAIAIAGGVSEFNVSYLYVTRKVTGQQPLYDERNEVDSFETARDLPTFDKHIELQQVEPSEGGKPFEFEDEMLEMISPYARNQRGHNGVIISTSEMISDPELENLAAPEGFETDPVVQEEPAPEVAFEEAEPLDELAVTQRQTSTRVEWIFKDGTWVPVEIEEEVAGKPKENARAELPKPTEPLKEETSADYGWDQIGSGGTQTRVIRIPVDKLLGGDPRYNIIVRPGDTISVPVDLIGEFWVMGNVNAQGPIALTGRPITLKMAIASAGGLGPLAWPKKVEVIRRIGRNKEEIVMVDLEKIAKGLQPDFFIKPNDLINVGTHGTSRWLATLRNAFRAEYGFGFTYSRNFADADFGYRGFPLNWSMTDLYNIF